MECVDPVAIRRMKVRWRISVAVCVALMALTTIAIFSDRAPRVSDEATARALAQGVFDRHCRRMALRGPDYDGPLLIADDKFWPYKWRKRGGHSRDGWLVIV
jgi:hypothetical protein